MSDSPDVCDVLVVGAGPAGAAVARQTASAGLETIVVDRQRAIGATVRTSGMTALATATRVGAPRQTYHVLERLRFSGPTTSAVFSASESFCVLDVRGFYRWLSAQAAAEGAHFLCGATVREVLFERDFVAGCLVEVCSDRPRRIRARVVVDASGHRAHVSKLAGLHDGFRRFGVGAEYELLAPDADQSEAVLIVGEHVAPTGYGWSFPWGDDRVRLGVGLHHADVRDDPKKRLAQLFASESSCNLGLRDARIVEYHFGLIPAEQLARRLVGNGIVAVGDAAGQASLVVGEGIRISLVAGEMAGEAIARALARGRSDRDALAPYERWFLRDFRRQLDIGARINRRLTAGRDDERWDRRVRMLRTMSPEMVFDLLQSRIRRGTILRWLIRRPISLARMSILARTPVGRH